MKTTLSAEQSNLFFGVHFDIYRQYVSLLVLFSYEYLLIGFDQASLSFWIERVLSHFVILDFARRA